MLLYAVCVVLRLARFNALLDDDTRPAYTREFFTGMPAPCGAVGAIGPLVAMMQFGQGWWTSHWFVCVWLAANAALLVSRVPTLALKAISVPENAAPILLILVAAAAAGLLLFPYVLVLLIIAGYVCHHAVHHPQPAMGGGAPRGVGRQAAAAAGGPPRCAAGRPEPPVGGPARVAPTRLQELT